MPRQRGGARPAARPAPARAPAQQQTRPASTAVAPAQRAPPPAVAQPGSQGPGLFGQMAATAGGVAVGSTVGHMMGAGLSSMFGGGSSAPAEAQAAPVAQQNTNQWGDQSTARSCEADAKSFTQCLEATKGDMSSCAYYLEQLKACQAMASNY